MKKPLIVLAGCLVACLGLGSIAPTALAAEKPAKIATKSGAVTHRNEQYDTNKDGRIDDQERTVMKADRAAKRQARLLAKYDANQNGQIDADEEAKHQADLEKRRQRRAELKKAKAAAAADPTPPDVADGDEEDDDPTTP